MSGTNNLFNKNFSNQSGIVADNIACQTITTTTQPTSDSSEKVATTQYVKNNIAANPGSTGPTGRAGNNGTNGSTGSTGPTGRAGNNGTNGFTGPTGPGGGTSQWSTNGSSVYYNSGSIGIGTSAPQDILQLTATQANILITSNNGGASNKTWGMGPNGTTFYMGAVNDSGVWGENWVQATRTNSTINNVCFPYGNIGIRTTSPAYNLDVNGSIRCTSINYNAPMFSAYGASSTYSAGVVSPVYNQNIEYNIGSCYNTSTCNFQPNVAGYYQFTAMTYNGALTATLQLILYKNGGIYKYLNGAYGTGGGDFVSGTCITYLNGTTDYVNLYVYCTNSYTALGGSTLEYFQGTYLRSG